MMTQDNGLQETIEHYHDLLAQTDLDRVVGAYATDTLIVNADGETYYGDEHPDRGKIVIFLFWGDFIRYPSKKAVLDTVELQVYGQIAYELCRYHLACDGEEGVEIEEGVYLAIWKRQDDEWQIGLQTFSSSDTPLTGL